MLANTGNGSQSVTNRPEIDIKLAKNGGQKYKALIKPRDVTVDDLPSDLSMDEWGEIQKYGQKLHEDEIRAYKQKHIKKAMEVKGVLDKQIKDRVEQREK